MRIESATPRCLGDRRSDRRSRHGANRIGWQRPWAATAAAGPPRVGVRSRARLRAGIRVMWLIGRLGHRFCCPGCRSCTVPRIITPSPAGGRLPAAGFTTGQPKTAMARAVARQASASTRSRSGPDAVVGAVVGGDGDVIGRDRLTAGNGTATGAGSATTGGRGGLRRQEV